MCDTYQGKIVVKERLRTGYTTGSCSAAAAKAAAMELILGVEPERTDLILPDGKMASWEPVKVQNEVESKIPGEELLDGYWKVQKDSGDDPDVTNGSWIYARVSWISQEELQEKKLHGRGYWLEEYPFIYLEGGIGIGIASLPGLSCPVGHYAINPVPRRMILEAVASLYQDSMRCASQTKAFMCMRANVQADQIMPDYALLVQLAIPAGVELSEKTFNPKLGIQGGISVLGTTGIVRPMSEEALLETIRLDIHMKAVAGQKTVILTPGNYGETYLKESLGMPLGEAVICSNFAEASAGMLADEKIEQVLFVGHIGKLVKIAAGMPNTHSKYGDRRMETLSKITDEVLCKNRSTDKKAVKTVLTANTTDEAIGYLKLIRLHGNMDCNMEDTVVGSEESERFQDRLLADLVLQRTAWLVKRQMEAWSEDKVSFEVIAFSSANQCSGCTEEAYRLFQAWKLQNS
jgi:cobalt-precorrin-5B (C1)-methyltransferase